MKFSPFKRFGFVVAPCAFIAVISFFQLFDPSVFGEKHPVLCWIGGIGGTLAALYNLYLVGKNSNT